MQENRIPVSRKLLLIPLSALFLAAGGATSFLFATCGPFTDVGTLICPFVLELYYSGITAGTSSTTFSPNNPVTRGQMAVFTSTALDLSLARSSRRAALGQWWTPQAESSLGITALGGTPGKVQSDGADLWVANTNGYVQRVRASDGSLLETWNAPGPIGQGILVAMGRVFVADASTLYMIDPSQAPGPLTAVAPGLGSNPIDIAFDGARIWTANQGSGPGGSVSIITPGPTLPWAVTTVTQGFASLYAMLFDGSNIWVVDLYNLLKIDSAGNILQTIPVGSGAQSLTFDGKNIWVPYGSQFGSFVHVFRASSGSLLSYMTLPGIFPRAAAFDGERVFIATQDGILVLWNAARLAPIGNPNYLNTYSLYPQQVCSDGINFWITGTGSIVGGDGKLARF
jgi:hypothetical protein